MAKRDRGPRSGHGEGAARRSEAIPRRPRQRLRGRGLGRRVARGKELRAQIARLRRGGDFDALADLEAQLRERLARSSRASARAAATLPIRCFTPASNPARPIASSPKIDACRGVARGGRRGRGSLTHRNASTGRSRRQRRFDQERHSRPSVERVVQRLQDEVGDGVEIRRLLHFEADPKFPAESSVETEAAERGDGGRGRMAGPRLACDVVIEAGEAASRNIYVRGSKTHCT